MWVRRYRETGSVAPGKIGGYKPNTLGGAHGDWLIERTDTDFTLRGLVAELGARGVKVGLIPVTSSSSTRLACPELRRRGRRRTWPLRGWAPTGQRLRAKVVLA